ncbi:hypothetical protein ACFL6N_00965 [Thermodesulfobacteriota bacterium]
MNVVTSSLKATGLLLCLASTLALTLSLAVPENGVRYIVGSIVLTAVLLILLLTPALRVRSPSRKQHLVEAYYFNTLMVKYPLTFFYLIVSLINLASYFISGNKAHLLNLKILIPFTLFLGMCILFLTIFSPEWKDDVNGKDNKKPST